MARMTPVFVRRGPAEPGDPDERAAFLLDLGLSLSKYGASSYRIEEAIDLCADSLDVTAESFALPTSLFMSVGEGREQRVYLRRVEPGDPHLEKLAAVDRVFNEVGDGTIGVGEGRARLAEIERSERYPNWVIGGCFPVIASTAGVFLGGGWRGVVTSCAIGLAVGVLVMTGGRDLRWRRLMDFLAGLTSSVLAAAAGVWVWREHGVDVPTVILAGLIALLPGLTLTLAMGELAMKHLVAGSTRLVGALMIFVGIGFGLGIGTEVGAWMGVESVAPEGLPGWVTPLALLVATVAVGVFFRARPRDFGVVLLGIVSAFYGARLGSALLDPRLGVMVGAFLLGVSANGYARWRDRPSGIVSLPGMLMLVPGGLGLRGFTQLMEADAVGGVQTVVTVTIVAAGLVTGLLLASAVVPPRKVL